MKKRIVFWTIAILIVVLCTTISLHAQDKPHVYVNGKGNTDVRTNGEAHRNWFGGLNVQSHSTISQHDQTMELAKDMAAQCQEVIVTLNPDTADYAVDLNHEAFHGLIHHNDQIMVANHKGDVIFTSATRAVTHAVKNACTAINADWVVHGSTASLEPKHATPEAKPAPQAQQDAAPASQQQESLGDYARRLKGNAR